MTTETDLCNEALSAGGVRASLGSMAERTPEATQCRLFYNSTLRSMLRAAPWNFARGFSGYLTLLKAAPGTPENPIAGNGTWQPSYPAPPWLYSYALPPNSVMIRYVSPMITTGGLTSGQVPLTSAPLTGPYPVVQLRAQRFIIASDQDSNGNDVTVILTNLSQATCVFTKAIKNPDLFDDSFHIAFVSALAARLIVPLAGDKSLWNGLRQEAMQRIQEARVRDGDEALEIHDHIPDWIQARGYAADAIGGVGGFSPDYEMPSFLV